LTPQTYEGGFPLRVFRKVKSTEEEDKTEKEATTYGEGE